jgi:hypothetical protein
MAWAVSAWQSQTLSTGSYTRHIHPAKKMGVAIAENTGKKVHPAGFEPATLGSEARCQRLAFPVNHALFSVDHESLNLMIAILRDIESDITPPLHQYTCRDKPCFIRRQRLFFCSDQTCQTAVYTTGMTVSTGM